MCDVDVQWRIKVSWAELCIAVILNQATKYTNEYLVFDGET